MILPLLIFGLFLIAVMTQTDLIVEKDSQPSRAREAADLVIEPEDNFKETKKAWDALLNKTQELLMRDIKAIDDALTQSFELKKIEKEE